MPDPPGGLDVGPTRLHHVATAVTGRGCALRARASWRLALCTGLEVARLEAAGYLGSTKTRTASALDVRAGAVLSWRMLDAIRMRLDADLGLMAVRPSFTMNSTFAAPSTLSFRTGLSLEIGIR